MVYLWLRQKDVGLLESVCKKASIIDQEEEIVRGSLDDAGFLGGVGRVFVLGREMVWKPFDTDQLYRFARINNLSLYPEGLILTPYNALDVRYHLGTRTIDKTTKLSRVELEGSDKLDFVKRVYMTFFGSLVAKHTKKDNHFLLYSTSPSGNRSN